MNDIKIRDAAPRDKNAVLDFCRNTWDWGDYIEHVWDYWLCDKSGKLIVATYEDRPVAVVHIAFISGEEAWLEGMRIAPELREKRIGTALSDWCLKLIRQSGVRVVRYLTLSSNTAVHRMGSRHGFKHISSCHAFWSELTPGDTEGVTKLQPALRDMLWTFIEHSEMYNNCAGLYSKGWIYRDLSKKQLDDNLTRGSVYALAGSLPLDAFAIVSTSWLHNGPVIGYIDGKDFSAMTTLASELRSLDADPGPVDRRIDANFPVKEHTKKLFIEAGYHPYYEEPFYLYELKLP